MTMLFLPKSITFLGPIGKVYLLLCDSALFLRSGIKPVLVLSISLTAQRIRRKHSTSFFYSKSVLLTIDLFSSCLNMMSDCVLLNMLTKTPNLISYEKAV